MSDSQVDVHFLIANLQSEILFLNLLPNSKIFRFQTSLNKLLVTLHRELAKILWHILLRPSLSPAFLQFGPPTQSAAQMSNALKGRRNQDFYCFKISQMNTNHHLRKNNVICAFREYIINCIVKWKSPPSHGGIPTKISPSVQQHEPPICSVYFTQVEVTDRQP